MRCFVLLAATLLAPVALSAQLRFEISVPSTTPLHGHLILVVTQRAEKSTDKPAPEPRFQLEENYESAQGFGVDVDNLSPGKPILIDAKTIGYPLENLAALSAGDYTVQAVFNVYEQFHLADGRNLWLPPDKGEGQHWNRKPGNPYNAPVDLHLDPTSSTPIKLTLDKVIAPIEGTDEDPVQIAAKSPAAKWLKFVRFKSEKLSKFWGRDTYLGAWVLLPDGFDSIRTTITQISERRCPFSPRRLHLQRRPRVMPAYVTNMVTNFIRTGSPALCRASSSSTCRTPILTTMTPTT
jgi:hypothetical protein